jgi:ABC-type Fe3+-citrate transport system substrate-binding protein
MTIQKPKLIFQILLGIFLLSFGVIACNNSSDSKSSTDSTTVKSDSTTPMMDTTNKMDTGKPKPVKPGE